MRRHHDVAVLLSVAQLVLMACVVAAFIVDSIVDTRAGDAVTHHVDDIMENAMPSVEYLSDARGELRTMETIVQRAVHSGNAATAGPAAVALASGSQAMDATLAEYVALPSFPGEPELQHQIVDAHARLDPSMDKTLAALGSGDMARAQAWLTTAERDSDSLDSALHRTVVFNATHATRIGQVMRAERSTLDRRILVVDGVLGALALAATAMAAATWRRAVTMLQSRVSDLDMFAGRVAHDLLSPLMAVSMGLSMAKMRASGDAAATAMMERSQRALERARGLVAGLLEFARAGASPSAGETAAVRDTIRGVIECVDGEATAAQVDLQLEPCPDVRVACAPGVMVSLVQNLVRNAIKFMDDSPQRRVSVRVRNAGAFVRVEVEDTGPGVPEPIRTTLFEPFVRGTDAVPGAGLGLATVKRLAEGHGGRVGWRSSMGEGSVFWFELPRATPSADQSERAGHPSGSATVAT